ncbi:MAG: hypothetical protein ACTSSF_00260 [Candidatus Heimdallarchaeaceae archaeon]
MKENEISFKQAHTIMQKYREAWQKLRAELLKERNIKKYETLRKQTAEARRKYDEIYAIMNRIAEGKEPTYKELETYPGLNLMNNLYPNKEG